MFFALNCGIHNIKIGQKSGNPVPDLFHFGGNGMRCIIPSSEECIFSKCRTKFSDHAGKPYKISILSNVKIQLFHRTVVRHNGVLCSKYGDFRAKLRTLYEIFVTSFSIRFLIYPSVFMLSKTSYPFIS